MELENFLSRGIKDYAIENESRIKLMYLDNFIDKFTFTEIKYRFDEKGEEKAKKNGIVLCFGSPALKILWMKSMIPLCHAQTYHFNIIG